MERTTESHVYAAFIRLANALNKPVYINEERMKRFLKNNEYYPQPKIKAEKYLQVGSWCMNNASGYGGWVIEEMVTDGGGVSHPFGSGRLKASHFYDAVQFALQGIWIVQKEGSKT